MNIKTNISQSIWSTDGKKELAEVNWIVFDVEREKRNLIEEKIIGTLDQIEKILKTE